MVAPIRIAAIATIVLMGVSCGPAISDSPAHGAISDQVVLQELESLWSDTGDGGGGYRSTPNLAAPPSLYLTSWTLRIADRAGVTVPQLSHAEATTWLKVVVEHPDGPDDPLPPLERVWLAAEALRALHEQVPAGPVDRVLATLKAGGQYRYSAKESTSWAATQSAVDVMRIANLPVPDDVVRLVAASLPTVSKPASVARLDTQAVIDSFLPLWQLADDLLPAAERAPGRDALKTVVTAQAVAATGPGASGPLWASVFVNLQAIAGANDIELPIPQPDFLRLRTPDGFLTLSSSAPVADPQLTYDGMLLGAAPDPRLLEAIRRTAGPSGWRANLGPIEPQTTFLATLVSHALGDQAHDAILRVQTGRWLTELAGNFPDVTASVTQLRNTFFVLALARDLGVAIPETIGRSATALLTGAAQSKDLARETWLLRLGEAVNQRPPAEVVQSVRAPLLGLPLRTMEDVYALQVGAEVLHDRALEDRALQAARTLALGAGYGFRAGAPATDLRSTTFGIALVTASQDVRQQAIAPFSSPQGAWMFPPPNARGNVVSPLSIYLGYVLLGRVTNNAGIFFYD